LLDLTDRSLSKTARGSFVKVHGQLGHGGAFLDCLDAIMDYRAANAIVKLSQNYDFLGDEGQKDQSSRVEAQEAVHPISHAT